MSANAKRRRNRKTGFADLTKAIPPNKSELPQNTDTPPLQPSNSPPSSSSSSGTKPQQRQFRQPPLAKVDITYGGRTLPLTLVAGYDLENKGCLVVAYCPPDSKLSFVRCGLLRNGKRQNLQAFRNGNRVAPELVSRVLQNTNLRASTIIYPSGPDTATKLTLTREVLVNKGGEKQHKSLESQVPTLLSNCPDVAEFVGVTVPEIQRKPRKEKEPAVYVSDTTVTTPLCAPGSLVTQDPFQAIVKCFDGSGTAVGTGCIANILDSTTLFLPNHVAQVAEQFELKSERHSLSCFESFVDDYVSGYDITQLGTCYLVISKYTDGPVDFYTTFGPKAHRFKGAIDYGVVSSVGHSVEEGYSGSALVQNKRLVGILHGKIKGTNTLQALYFIPSTANEDIAVIKSPLLASV